MPSNTATSAKKPYNVYLICDDIAQFDQKFLNDMAQCNCNLIPVAPAEATTIKKNRALKAIISVPNLSSGCGFALLNSLRNILGRNTPMMVFAPIHNH